MINPIQRRKEGGSGLGSTLGKIVGNVAGQLVGNAIAPGVGGVVGGTVGSSLGDEAGGAAGQAIAPTKTIVGGENMAVERRANPTDDSQALMQPSAVLEQGLAALKSAHPDVQSQVGPYLSAAQRRLQGYL